MNQLVGAINVSVPITSGEKVTGQPRAIGAGRLSVVVRDGRSVISGLHQSGSMKVLFPRSDGHELQAVFVNTAGGVTGGDRFTLDIDARADTTVSLTTQAAERAYRAQPGETGTLDNHLTLGPNARLHWLPQETILFDGCAMARRTTVDMATDARMLFVEPLVFGRTAMGETVRQGTFRDRLTVHRGGELIFLDGMDLCDDIAAHLAQPNIANGAGALVSMLYVAPDAESWLPIIRDMLPETGGVSLIRDDVLFLRALAQDSFVLRQFLVPMLNRLTGDQLPRPWMI